MNNGTLEDSWIHKDPGFQKLTTNEPMHMYWIYPFAALVAILVNSSNNAFKAGHVSIHVDANIDTIKYGI